MAFIGRARDVLHTFRHDEQLSRLQGNGAIPEADFHLALQHEKYFIGVLMVVPDKVPEELHQLELIVVHLRDDTGRPVSGDLRELVRKIDGFGGHDLPRSHGWFDRMVDRAREINTAPPSAARTPARVPRWSGRASPA